jgi:hypothetical protein
MIKVERFGVLRVTLDVVAVRRAPDLSIALWRAVAASDF